MISQIHPELLPSIMFAFLKQRIKYLVWMRYAKKFSASKFLGNFLETSKMA